MATPIIRTEQLYHEVTSGSERLQILRGIDLSIDQGTSVAIVGASGSGKSTLLGMLAGLDRPSSGTIWLADQPISQMTEEQRAKVRAHNMGFVFQNFQLLTSLTALENVMLPLEVKGSQQAESKAKEFLSRVGLGQRLNHYPSQLSGGEQQRVAIARAFACEAPVLFADEPTGNLDGQTGQVITDLLFSLNQEQKTTLVLVTHDMRLASRCQRVLTMDSGLLKEAV